MSDLDFSNINALAVLTGFLADFAFTLLVGFLVVSLMTPAGSQQVPPTAELVANGLGVVGALIGGFVAGKIAGRQQVEHGLLASGLGLVISLCFILPSGQFTLAFLGFAILNLVAAGYGGHLSR
ncbi:MAG: DUF3792 family protein [Chloroflexi bacterium]|nr:MAG: DUF3792 family protein [Chloroflexota bacterium]